jgi:hypothetical protein
VLASTLLAAVSSLAPVMTTVDSVVSAADQAKGSSARAAARVERLNDM